MPTGTQLTPLCPWAEIESQPLSFTIAHGNLPGNTCSFARCSYAYTTFSPLVSPRGRHALPDVHEKIAQPNGRYIEVTHDGVVMTLAPSQPVILSESHTE